MSESAESGVPLRQMSRLRTARPKIRNGCTTCKRRRVKCDENRPICNKCAKTGLRCDFFTVGYVPAESSATAAASASLASRLGYEWLECEDCTREFDSTIWGRTCPDCGFVNPEGKGEIPTQPEGRKPQVLAQESSRGNEQLLDLSQVRGNHADSTDSAGETLPGQASLQSNGRDGWPFCHVMIFIGLLTFIGSLVLALWWSFTRNDVSGGFTMAAYVVAVGGLPIASMQMRHSHRCDCWKNKGDIRPNELEST